MENKGLVSVIIPVYNVEQYLEECIKSVLAQTYENWEMILVDDGSTDCSGNICDEYQKKDERIQVVHQQGGGASVARNTGVSKANGEYIYFLDSDDWILPETLEELMTCAKKEQAQIVYFDANSFYDHDSNAKIEQRYIRKHSYETSAGYEVLEQHLKNKEYHCSVPLMLLDREWLRKTEITFIPHIIYEDMIFTYEILCKADCVAQVKKALYQRRYRKNSVMTTKKSLKNFTSACRVYEEVKMFSMEEGSLEKKAATDYIVRCAFNALNIYRSIEKNEQKSNWKVYQMLKKDILNHKAFGNKALRARCYGRIVWFGYKVLEKGFKILKG